MSCALDTNLQMETSCSGCELQSLSGLQVNPSVSVPLLGTILLLVAFVLRCPGKQAVASCLCDVESSGGSSVKSMTAVLFQAIPAHQAFQSIQKREMCFAISQRTVPLCAAARRRSHHLKLRWVMSCTSRGLAAEARPPAWTENGLRILEALNRPHACQR